MDGLFSVKSDVFSFGVLLLEVISGKKNTGFYYEDPTMNLIKHITRKWRNVWSAPVDSSENYGKCGEFGICNLNNAQICSCLPCFEPKTSSDEYWKDGSHGCVRKREFLCGQGDGFLKLEKKLIALQTGVQPYRKKKTAAVIKRLMTDVPFGVLLFDWLDLSLVALITARYLVGTKAAKQLGAQLHSSTASNTCISLNFLLC
ncbi:hypothetical protein Sjap_025422 [Stephania japonica]|uniref:S-locus glycoprotein domain-containing protein n=1 Tax=Stephania japonica TaxID=461633 RepID=A0AAP0E1T2_9MAGN